MSTPVGTFVEAGWPRHAKDPGPVFDEGRALVGRIEVAADVQPLGRLLFHVGAEHLGRYAETLAVLDQLRAHKACVAGSADARALWRFSAAAHLCLGDTVAGERAAAEAASDSGFPLNSDRAAALALAAAALVGQRKTPEATKLFEQALALATYGPTKDDPLSRALAVTANNLAGELDEKTDRTEPEDRLLLKAAETARKYWEIAGTWLHVERAEYRLACTCATLGLGERAVQHAAKALALCAANGGDAMERFFAHEGHARASLAAKDRDGAAGHRKQAADLLEKIEDTGNRAYCEGELAKLDARLA